MKRAFAGATAILVALSLVAWRLQPPPAAPGRVPLVWVSDANPLRDDQVKLFARMHPGTHPQLDPANVGLEKVIVQCLAGVGPDVFDCYDGYQLISYARSGVAMDVTEILRKKGIDVARDTYRGTHGTAMFDGRVYGVPTNMAADAVWFHKDVFDEAGIPYPKGPMKWDEAIRLAKRLTVKDGNGRITRYGLLFPWWNWRHIFAGFGARVYSPDGTRCVVDDPKAVAAVQLMVDLVHKHRVAPTPAEEAGMATQGGFGSGDISFFAAKRGAMAIGGRWWLSQLRQAKGLRLGVFESPHQTVRQFRGYGRSTLINRATRHPEVAIKFLEYLASPEYNNLINAQADGVSAFHGYNQGEAFLHDPKHPEEDANAVWREAAERAIPDEISPFVDGSVAGRLLQLQLDLVRGGMKEPAVAMRDAARAVNEAIAKKIAEDPTLAARYRALKEGRK